MKLQRKIAALFRAVVSPRPRQAQRPPQVPPGRRPTPTDDPSLPLDPAEAWGTLWEPAPERNRLLNDLIEQLALEAYFNGEGFSFSDQELEARISSFLDRMVQAGRLTRREPSPGAPGRTAAGRDRWIQAQQTRIGRLLAWWRAHGGPDVEARVL